MTGAREKLESIANRARDLGVETPGVRSSVSDAVEDTGYDRLMPRLVDLLDAMRDRADYEAGSPTLDLIEDTERLLGVLQQAERSAAASEQEHSGGVAVSRAPFPALKAEYEQLFRTCDIRPQWVGQVAWHVKKLTGNQSHYKTVGERLGIPWCFVGIVHGLEGSFSFGGHLHNGDPLTGRTTHVPKGRPVVWNPPNDWASSAVDALEGHGFANQADWSLARMLYRWEAYNGFGTRNRGVNTPYLWSFSHHYDRGKYDFDGHWDPTLVSKQCGAAVMLKALVDAGAVVVV